MISDAPTRRTLLKVLAAGGVAATFCSGSGCGPGGIVDAGTLDDLAIDTLVPIAGSGVAIGRDAEGVYAVTTICTHLQCDMAEQGTITPEELFCACHDSRFDGAGAVLEGPATEPLSFFEVSITEDGTLSIDADSVVDPETRLAV